MGIRPWEWGELTAGEAGAVIAFCEAYVEETEKARG